MILQVYFNSQKQILLMIICAGYRFFYNIYYQGMFFNKNINTKRQNMLYNIIIKDIIIHRNDV